MGQSGYWAFQALRYHLELKLETGNLILGLYCKFLIAMNSVLCVKACTP